MENQITIREAVTENDVALFWEQRHAYYKRDMFPDPTDWQLLKLENGFKKGIGEEPLTGLGTTFAHIE